MHAGSLRWLLLLRLNGLSLLPAVLRSSKVPFLLVLCKKCSHAVFIMVGNYFLSIIVKQPYAEHLASMSVEELRLLSPFLPVVLETKSAGAKKGETQESMDQILCVGK